MASGDALSRALRGLRRDGARAARKGGEPGLMIAIGLAEPRKGDSPDVEAGDARSLGLTDNLGTQRAHEANMHGAPTAANEEEMEEGESEESDSSSSSCPLCGGDHEASEHEYE